MLTTYLTTNMNKKGVVLTWICWFHGAAEIWNCSSKYWERPSVSVYGACGRAAYNAVEGLHPRTTRTGLNKSVPFVSEVDLFVIVHRWMLRAVVLAAWFRKKINNVWLPISLYYTIMYVCRLLELKVERLSWREEKQAMDKMLHGLVGVEQEGDGSQTICSLIINEIMQM